MHKPLCEVGVRMLGSATNIYEIVRGQIKLSRRQDFFHLHGNRLLPMIRDAGIEPVLLLVTEVGQFGRFLDVYRYDLLTEYGIKTDRLLGDARIPQYYSEVWRMHNGFDRSRIGA